MVMESDGGGRRVTSRTSAVYYTPLLTAFYLSFVGLSFFFFVATF